jgi:hypothetical protein
VLRRDHQRPSKRRERGRSWRRRGSPRPGNWTTPGRGAKRSPLLTVEGADVSAQLAQARELEAKLAEEYRAVRLLRASIAGPHSAPPAGRRLRPGLPPPPGCTRLNLPAYPACSLRSAAAPAVMAAYRRRRWVPVPEPKPSREEMIETYLQTLAKVVGRYNEIRAISCRRVGFLCNWVP